MAHFLRLLLIIGVTGTTCLGVVAPSVLSNAATRSEDLLTHSAAEGVPLRTAQAQTNPPAKAQSPQPSPQPSAQTQTNSPTTQSDQPTPQPSARTDTLIRTNSTNFEQMMKWLILGLIPIGVVGTALYCLRQPARPKPVGLRPTAVPAQPSETELPAEGKPTFETRSSAQSRHPSVQLPNQPEATVSVRANAERANSEAIEPQLQDGSPLARTTRMAKVDIVEALINDLHHPEVAQRRKSIWELGQRGDSRAIQPLVDLLVDADSQQRSLILAAIAEISTRTLKPMHRALLMSLQDESADVRKNAIRDITRIYDQMAQVSQLLQYAASDADTDVQETARWALGQLNRLRTSPEPELQPSKPDELPRRDPRLGDPR